MASELNKISIIEKYPANDAEVQYTTQDSLTIHWVLTFKGEFLAQGEFCAIESDRYSSSINIMPEAVDESDFEEMYYLYFEKIKPYCIDIIEYRVEDDDVIDSDDDVYDDDTYDSEINNTNDETF